jgi:hypothetical protein
MRLFLLCFLLAMPFAGFAQAKKLKTDTALAGCYLLPDTNTVSFKVIVIHNGIASVEKNVNGRNLPPDLSGAIMQLAKGDIVLYDEITVVDTAGVLRKSPSIRYVIGMKNTRPALPETITREAAAAMTLNETVVSFSVTFADGGTFYEFACKGNTVSPDAQAALLKLEPGTKIFFEKIVARNEVGNIKFPVRTYVIDLPQD